MDGKRYELVWKVFSVNKWKCSVARFTRAEGGAKRKALARRRSAAALDRHRTLGSTKKDPRHQGISRNPVAEGAPESVAPSAEGGPDSRSCLNLVVGRLTVPTIESRCNQLKLGHPRQRITWCLAIHNSVSAKIALQA